MQNPKERKRAKAMEPAERRAAIVTAALPLVEEHGAAVTTKQIAAAAGIAEGTVFRVFADKTELLIACLRTVVLADTTLARVHAIDPALPLTEKLELVVDALGDWVSRIWRYSMVLHELGYRPERDAKHEQESEHSPQKQGRYLRDAVEQLLRQDPTALGIDPGVAARLFQGLVFSNLMHAPRSAEEPVSGKELVDLFLHGALGSTEKEGK